MVDIEKDDYTQSGKSKKVFKTIGIICLSVFLAFITALVIRL